MLQLISAISDPKQRATAEAIFESYGKKMFLVANKILNDHHDSEDAVMEAFRRIIKGMQKFTDLSQAETEALVLVYVRNTAIDIYNTNKRRIGIVQELSINDVSNESEIEELDMGIKILVEKIKSMPYIYSSVILLKYHYGYSSKEIADALNITENSVRVRTSRAKEILKASLEREGITV